MHSITVFYFSPFLTLFLVKLIEAFYSLLSLFFDLSISSLFREILLRIPDPALVLASFLILLSWWALFFCFAHCPHLTSFWRAKSLMKNYPHFQNHRLHYTHHQYWGRGFSPQGFCEHICSLLQSAWLSLKSSSPSIRRPDDYKGRSFWRKFAFQYHFRVFWLIALVVLSIFCFTLKLPALSWRG